MKFSTFMSVVTVAVAMVACGCRYDKANAKGGAGADSAGATDLATDAEMSENAQEGSLSDASTAGKNFEDLYQRCTDVSFEPVYFGFDSTVVPQSELGKVDAVVSHLNDHNNRVVVIEGNCDDRGSNEYNLSLGENRAIIVRNYLVQSGITADRIQTRSYGEEKPAVVGSDESAWSKNRRGEFVIFQK